MTHSALTKARDYVEALQLFGRLTCAEADAWYAWFRDSRGRWDRESEIARLRHDAERLGFVLHKRPR